KWAVRPVGGIRVRAGGRRGGRADGAVPRRRGWAWGRPDAGVRPARRASRPEAQDLRVVVADLVVELGVDVHAVVAERAAPADRRADQDLVQHLAVALVDVGVTL